MSASHFKGVVAVASGLALVGAAAPAAQAREWRSFLSDTQVQSVRGGSLRAVLSDEMKISSTVAPFATVRVNGSARSYFPTGTRPPYIKLVDKLIFTGVRISSVTAGSGGWSVTGGSTSRTLTYTKTARAIRNNAHVYRGITAQGSLRKIAHEATGSTRIGTAGVSVQAYDSCGVFNICN